MKQENNPKRKTDAPYVRPITISQTDSLLGPRIGGNKPEGILPPKISAATEYFATISLDEAGAREVSLFVDLNDEERSIYRNVSQLYSEEDFAQIVVHPKSTRSDSSYLCSQMSGRSLQIASETRDIIVEPGGELLLPSKLGGRPYFYHYTVSYIEALNRLLEEGFVLFLQLTWAGPKASPSGPWPFDEYTFHLLAKETAGGMVWRYGWG